MTNPSPAAVNDKQAPKSATRMHPATARRLLRRVGWCAVDDLELIVGGQFIFERLEVRADIRRHGRKGVDEALVAGAAHFLAVVGERAGAGGLAGAGGVEKQLVG